MPIPLSFNERMALRFVAFKSRLISPWGMVYLQALERRLSSNISIRCLSAETKMDSSVGSDSVSTASSRKKTGRRRLLSAKLHSDKAEPMKRWFVGVYLFKFEQLCDERMEFPGYFHGPDSGNNGLCPRDPVPGSNPQRCHDKRHRRANVVCRVDEETYFVFVVFLLELVALIAQDEIENEAYYK